MKHSIIILATIMLAACSSKQPADDRDTANVVADLITNLTADQSADDPATEVVDETDIIDPAMVEAIRSTAITQYSLVDGTSFRSNMGSVLRNLGFDVVEDKKDYDDDMATYDIIRATRPGIGGTTTLHLTNGEDVVCTIDFANATERDIFVESMQKAGYTVDGSLYSHPRNNTALPRLYVRVKGLRIKLITPFEMLPADF
ncbi:MAG: hypothetical protein NC111_06685 [Bacteroides sp.]|nr:hypothetical protein [Bacteroides sp.]MCM1413790.1 hypothetical protein [Bacteroides sp.]MCM1472191.1 hypothetical protein [Bacteroides sp.]